MGRGLVRLAAIVVGATACNEQCVTHPCPLGIVAMITVTSATPGVPLAGAFYTVSGPTRAEGVQCGSGTPVTCMLLGTAGTYAVDIGASGFQTIHRTIVATGTDPNEKTCDCGTTDTQHLDIALVPAT